MPRSCLRAGLHIVGIPVVSTPLRRRVHIAFNVRWFAGRHVDEQIALHPRRPRRRPRRR